MEQPTSSKVNLPAVFGGIKPGYLTTEFAGKCVIQIIAILVLLGVIPTGDQAHANELALGLISALEAAYAFSRAIVKANPQTAGPQISAEADPAKISFAAPKA